MMISTNVDPWRGRAQLIAGVGLGILAGRFGAMASYLTYLSLFGQRQPLWQTPDVPFESVEFRASDGIRLAGWFLPRVGNDGTPAPVIVFVHGWPWNRLGNQRGSTLIPDRTVSLLEPAQALHAAGFHVLLFDLRNHGLSEAAPPVTFGIHEARDLSGAVAYLRQRPDVDRNRVGLIGYSMGANTVLYGLPSCQPVRAAIAVQPVKANTFGPLITRALLGPPGPILYRLIDPIHRALGGPPLATVDPGEVATLAGDTTMLFIQGSHDPWGSLDEVRTMAERTPRAVPVIAAPAQDRYQGYLYVNQHLEEITTFFRAYL
jgi:acetyl esterase/lipase